MPFEVWRLAVNVKTALLAVTAAAALLGAAIIGVPSSYDRAAAPKQTRAPANEREVAIQPDKRPAIR
jgi:hypothetical protein